MARFFKERVKNKGLSPGALVFIGRKKVDQPWLRLIDYDKNDLQERDLDDIHESKDLKNSETVSWINLYGLHETEIIKNVGEIFDLHPLILEDILNTGQRPKLEDYDNCLFIVMLVVIVSAICPNSPAFLSQVSPRGKCDERLHRRSHQGG